MLWHNCPTEIYDIALLWGGPSYGSSSRFRRLLRSLPRPHPDHQLEWHLQLYDQYTRLKHCLEMREDTPLLSDEDLEELKVIRGAPLNIDDFDPIDVEKRFFFSKPTRHRWAKWLAEQYLEDGEVWPEPEKETRWVIDENGNRIPDICCVNYYANALWQMTDAWIDDGTMKHNPWWIVSRLYPVDPTGATGYGKVYTGPANEYHEFEATSTLLYQGGSRYGPNPQVPHIIIITYDTIIPDDRILRSELLLVASILRRNLALFPWLEHHTFPVLVLSFHETGARILQMHAENGYFIVRASRQLVFPTEDGSIPADGLIMLTWMLAEPMGETSFSNISVNASSEEKKVCRHEGDLNVASTLGIPVVDDTDAIPLKHRAN
ncbi:hypothetical protein CFAM422_004075 [Trichoderma lentiforme]|uniref:Uncharacterized protein n=1 Tax=Trichoderma lentiforme TaxID=1567552 RepID=A0A9P4XGR5_9HYPO|nr:hypothetical protein CFAM422_004075 [Trichoderma lentiforme]